MPAPDDATAAHLVTQYVAGASIRELARSSGYSRAVIRSVLTAAGHDPAPRGAGRPRLRARQEIDAQLADTIRDMYLDQRLTRREIAAALGIPEHRVRTSLERSAIARRTRGRLNREDRTRLPVSQLRRLYVDRQLTVAQVAARLGTTSTLVYASLHENGIPVRASAARSEDDALTVIRALYSDRQVAASLDRHRVPRRPTPGALSTRFPQPVPLTEAMLRELYCACGLSTVHIELLTGQPAVEVGRQLARLGIARRHPGGLSPWRQRVASTSAARAGEA